MYPTIVLLLGAMAWGLMWIPLKYFNGLGLEGVPLTIVAYGGLSVGAAYFLVRQFRHWLTHPKAMVGILLLGGFANVSFTVALVYGDVVRVMVLFYLLPAWGVIGGKLFLNEHADRWRWLAVVLSLAGAVLVLGGLQIFDAPPSWTDGLAVGAGFTLAMNNIVFRATPDLHVVSKVSVMLLGGFVVALLALLIDMQPMPEISLSTFVYVLLYGLLWILFATVCTQWAVTKMEAGRASIILIMELLTAVVSAMLITGESLTLLEWCGGILILAAAYIEGRRELVATP